MKHILLQKALKFKKRKIIKEPENYFYDNKLGAWMNIFNGSSLINSRNFRALATKKEDIETGEDHKGE